MMISDTALAEVQTAAAKADELLAAMMGELDASMNPDRVALRDLVGTDALGWASKAYSDTAFTEWSKTHRQSPDDFRTVHHLAIMHHARAIDLETGPRPSDGDPDWEAALALWQRLYEDDRFWDHLVEIACKGAKLGYRRRRNARSVGCRWLPAGLCARRALRMPSAMLAPRGPAH